MYQLYVPNGAFLVCSSGMSKQKLIVTSQSSMTIAGGKLAATRNDRMEDNHNCAKIVIAGAIIGAIIAGIVAAATVATGGLAGAAIIGACAAGGAIGGASVGLLAGLIPCICTLLTHDWIISHSEVLLEKQYALLEDSTLPCRFGGNVMIFYSEKAADAAVNLIRWDTACNVGIITITAFALGFAGVFKGIVTAGKAIYLGFADLGFKIGLTNLLKMAGSGVISYFIDDKIINPIVTAGKETFIYNPLGIDTIPKDTNIENIRNNSTEGGDNPEEGTINATTTVDNMKDASGVSGQTTTTQTQYEIYHIEGSGGSEINMGTSTSTTVESDLVVGNRNTTITQYDADVRISDTSGYAEGGTQTDVTIGNSYANQSASDWSKTTVKNALPDGKGLALGFLSDILQAIKNPMLSGPLEDFKKSLEDEEKEKENITVFESNI